MTQARWMMYTEMAILASRVLSTVRRPLGPVPRDRLSGEVSMLGGTWVPERHGELLRSSINATHIGEKRARLADQLVWYSLVIQGVKTQVVGVSKLMSRHPSSSVKAR